MKPTIEAVQLTAVDLVRRMCALTPADVKSWHWSGEVRAGL
jgi:hypothetical protein